MYRGIVSFEGLFYKHKAFSTLVEAELFVREAFDRWCELNKIAPLILQWEDIDGLSRRLTGPELMVRFGTAFGPRIELVVTSL